jgi:hypothetical protein
MRIDFVRFGYGTHAIFGANRGVVDLSSHQFLNTCRGDK